MSNIIQAVSGKLKALPQANLPIQSQAQAALNSLMNALAPATRVGEISEIMASVATELADTEDDFAQPSISGTIDLPAAKTYLQRLQDLSASQPNFTTLSATGRSYCFKFANIIREGHYGVGLFNVFEDGTNTPVFGLYEDGFALFSNIVKSVDTHLKLTDLTIIDLIKKISRSSVGDKPESFTILGMLKALQGTSGNTIVDLVHSLAAAVHIEYSYEIWDTLNNVSVSLHPSVSPMCIHMYEILKNAIQNSRLGTFFKEVLQVILNSKAATFISNLLAMYTKFKEYEEVIKDHWSNILEVAMESGMIGVLNYIIDYWLNHRRLESFDGGYLKLTDNEEFRPEALGVMVWNGICSVASQVIGVVSTALGPVFGAIGFAISTALSVITAPLHLATQQEVGCVQIDDTHFTSGAPLGFFQSVIPVVGNESIAKCFGSGIGSLFPVPGGYIIGGLVDKDHIGLEFHPSFAKLGYLTYEGNMILTHDELGIPRNINAISDVRIITSTVDWNDFIPSTQSVPLGILSPLDDSKVWLNVRANLAIFLLWTEYLHGHVDPTVPKGHYNWESWGHVFVDAPLWISCLQQNGTVFGGADWYRSRTSHDSLLFRDVDHMYSCLYCPTHYVPSLPACIKQELYGLVVPLTESFGWPLYPAKVTPGSTITSFVVANIVVAAASVTAIVGAMTIRSKVKKFQAKKAAAAEAHWSEMTKAAAAGDQQAFDQAYKSFKKSAFMNNISASIFGGTKISPYNYWNQSSTSEAATPAATEDGYASMLADVLNKKNSSTNSVDVTLEMIYKTITGHLPGEEALSKNL